MSETATGKKNRVRRFRHKGRGSQILIYLGKQFRFFINENDWKVLPMAAVIAGLVGMVIRKKFFVNMEGSLIGAFALTCTGIWNGCFNSIQAVCRERAIIKREHRSGMHISSYVAAHVIYQLFLCTAQTGLTMYVLIMMEIPFPDQGYMTSWMVLDIGISMLLITFASDMMSLFISSISHTTTGAMTIMPFVLIFQLVFSGGIIPLPDWSQSLSNYTISNYGMMAIASQSGYNELPMVTAWNILEGMTDDEIGGTVTVGQILDLLQSPAVEKHRDQEVLRSYTVGEAAEILNSAEKSLHLREKEITHAVVLRDVVETILTDDTFRDLREAEIHPAGNKMPGMTVESILKTMTASEEMNSLLDREISETLTLGQVLDFLQVNENVEAVKDETLNNPISLGNIIDFLETNEAIQEKRDETFTLKATIGDLFDLFGKEKIHEMILEKTAAASYKPEYERSVVNIVGNWIMLWLFANLFAALSVIVLEMIDKDKR